MRLVGTSGLRGRYLQGALAMGVSAGALWFTLRGKDPDALWHATRSADYRYVVGYVAVLLVVHVVRTVRWGILLEPIGRVPFPKLNAIFAVSSMAVLLLPLRLGEMARPMLVAEPPRIRASAAFSTVAVERTVDGLLTALLLVVTMFIAPVRVATLASVLRVSAVATLGAFVVAVVFLVVAYHRGNAIVDVARRSLARVSPRLGDWVAGTATTFLEGLRAVPARRGIACFLLMSIALLVLGGWSVQILARGFGLHLGTVEAFCVLAVVSLGLMIPSGPAMIGTLQAAAIVGLALFEPRAVVDTVGTAFANVLWVAQFVQVVGLGILFTPSRHVHLERVVSWGKPTAG